jgi:ADP-ribose pyrophosphatase YjhB (NUDIX family)
VRIHEPEIPAAGAIIFDERRRILLIRRSKPPAAGRWSVPGGKSEQHELAPATCIREVREETGFVVEVTRYAGRVLREAPSGGVYVIDDYLCRIVGGELRAGDDAMDAAWFTLAELAELQLAEGLVSALGEWDLLPE